MDVSLFILIAFFLGSIVRIFWGWLNSGESFDPRKFFSTLIITIVFGIPVGVGYLSANIIITDIAGLITICLTAFAAGFAVDDFIKQVPGLKKINGG